MAAVDRCGPGAGLLPAKGKRAQQKTPRSSLGAARGFEKSPAIPTFAFVALSSARKA